MDVVGTSILTSPTSFVFTILFSRLINNHPIGPAYMKRAWPVHFVIGWIGLYFRRGTVFGNRERGYTLPTFSHSTEKPSMINTMCRTPVHYTPGHAHDYLNTRSNFFSRSYDLSYMEDAAQLRRIFTIATCAMLIWRRFSPNIDQFGLDQVISYTPLISLYTTQDIGIAYAYWEHLLRPGQVEAG
jgi:hypothetical protein